MRHTLLGVLVLLSAASVATSVVPASAQTPGVLVESADVTYEGGAGIRILPPRERLSAGSTLVEALVLDPQVRQVLFYVDGELRTRRKRLPWRTKLKLDDPPREQTVRVEALDILERVRGSDELVFNRLPRPLRVSIDSVTRADGEVELEATVSVPDEVVVEEIDVFMNDAQIDTLPPSELSDGRLEVRFAAGPASDVDFVRVVARLVDGRSVEDTQLLSESIYQEEIQVQLVQLQVLVTDRQGRPLEGFRKDDFRIEDAGGPRQPAGLFEADDVSLLLGYALDSSGSMASIWQQTLLASRMFLDATLTPRDAGFLVDFDWHIELMQERTTDKAALEAALGEIAPEGGTALYDSVLYSLLQFDRQPGRRGLVVLTDGYDFDSTTDPKRTVELAQTMGVPIYIVALELDDSARLLPGPSPGNRSTLGTMQRKVGALAELKLLTDPTGGRLIRVRTLDQMREALAQINAEMRNQYVLTYYTDTPPEPGDPPRVSVEVEGMQGLEVRTVLGTDQIY